MKFVTPILLIILICTVVVLIMTVRSVEKSAVSSDADPGSGFMHSILGAFGMNISVNQGENGSSVNVQIGGDSTGEGALFNTRVSNIEGEQKVDLKMGSGNEKEDSSIDIQVQN
jgi:hypothetical protein